MRQRRFGGTGRDVAIIGQGTWQMGSAGAADALRQGIDLGMTHIDTAEMYTGAEAIVATAIAGQRDRVFLVSKVLPSHATRAGVIRACEQSLARLKTDHLDCYLLHWPGSTPLAGTVAGFEDLAAAGKILSWGVSNFDVPDLEALLRVAPAGRIACNQVLYHLGERAIEHAVLPWCVAHGVAVTAYSPFGAGDFPAGTSRGGRVLAGIAAAYDATPRQVALAFLVRDPAVFAIPKAANPAHAAENAGAGRLALTEQDLARIDAAFPRGAKPRTLPML
jgi:diketogulonate reductase-like aldo/keto reductase